MPWQVNGVFQRENPDFNTGDNIWQQDQQAGIKVIAYRHDFHDQDIADGIAATLNLDGYNAMRAALDIGGFKLTNVGAGTLNTDGVNFSQIIDSGSFNNGLRELTLHTPSGDLAPIVIPSGSGGGGEGTVSSIDIGEGLVGINDPITTVGDIALEVLDVGETVSGGITSLTIDKHGRVTQIIGGAFASTNLSNTVFSNSVRVESSTGSDTTISSAYEFGAGVMSSASYNDLQDTVRLTGSQNIDGAKTFIDQVFMTMAATIDGGFRLLNTPTSDPISEGVVWNDGGTLKISAG